MLFNIHVQPIEFLENSISSHLYYSIRDVATAYEKNDVNQLKVISQKYLSQYKNKPFDKNLLFKTAIACNFYEDLTDQRIFPSLAAEKLIMYFSGIVSNDNYWYYEDIFYFNSVTQLISAPHLYSFSLSLLEYVKNERIDSKIWYDLSLNTLLNSLFSLIKKDIEKAEGLSEKLNTLKIENIYAAETIRKRFMDCLIYYVKKKNSTQICELLEYLDFLGLNEMKLNFQVAFTQIKKIYDK